MDLVLGPRSSQWLGFTWMLGKTEKLRWMMCSALSKGEEEQSIFDLIEMFAHTFLLVCKPVRKTWSNLFNFLIRKLLAQSWKTDSAFLHLLNLLIMIVVCLFHFSMFICNWLINPSLYRVTKSVSNVSSIICLSQPISEVRDVPLSIFIDKSPVPTTKVFYYKENPKITNVLPDCSFDR